MRLGRSDRLLGEARLRPVRDPGRMQRHGTDLDALPRRELPVDVIDHLLALEIRMVVRDRNRERIEVELPRAERADDEVRPRERLVRGRRHVDPARDRLEVLDVERPWVEVTVPAY